LVDAYTNMDAEKPARKKNHNDAKRTMCNIITTWSEAQVS